ncbi:hypothetical protein ONZ45_g7674 [Pleurotus djamor]|nr:hypothetical protein ONZ45_g7674 [Pleurotus djamor]
MSSTPTPGPSSRTETPRTPSKRRDRSPVTSPKAAKRARAPVLSGQPSSSPSTPKKPFGRLKHADLSPAIKQLKDVLQLHIRICAGALTGAELPRPATSDIVHAFEKRHSNSQARIQDILRGTSSNSIDSTVSTAVASLRSTANSTTSKTALRITRVPNTTLQIIVSTMKLCGITVWAPDYTSPPSSFYNWGLQEAAIQSFQRAASTDGYPEVIFDPALAKDRSIVELLYAEIMSRFRKLARREARFPGSTKKNFDKNPVYTRRRNLWLKRRQYLKDHKYSRRTANLLASPDCCSDDERETDPNHPGFIIFPKTARSAKATALFRTIDAQIKKQTPPPRSNQHTRTPEKRERCHPTSETSDLSIRVPNPTPPKAKSTRNHPFMRPALDWFDPEYFNGLSVRWRALYRNCPIALPLEEDLAADSPELVSMPEKVFMEKYGNKVRALYNLPSEEEAEELLKDYSEEEEDSNDSSETPEPSDLGLLEAPMDTGPH